MDDLTSLCYFFVKSPKWQQYFDTFIDYHKDELPISDSNKKHVIRLTKTRWVERHELYKNYCILYRFVVPTFESICSPTLYKKFYLELREKHQKNGIRIRNRIKSSRSFCCMSKVWSSSRLCGFVQRTGAPETSCYKVTETQSGYYQAYQIIDQVLNDIRETKDNLDEIFHLWYEMACEMAKSVDVMSSGPRLAKYWSRYRSNVPSYRNNEDCESCYQRAIRVPVVDALIVNLHDRMADRKHTELFTFYPLFAFIKIWS